VPARCHVDPAFSQFMKSLTNSGDVNTERPGMFDLKGKAQVRGVLGMLMG